MNAPVYVPLSFRWEVSHHVAELALDVFSPPTTTTVLPHNGRLSQERVPSGFLAHSAHRRSTVLA